MRRRVSATQSAANPPAETSTAVRHAPLTATESPTARPSTTAEAEITSRAPSGAGASSATTPASSISPVNMPTPRRPAAAGGR